MFGLTTCFLFSRNKNTENAFSKENVFLDLLKITFLPRIFILPKMRFLVSTENTENEILLFPVFGSFGKIFSLKMKTEIQSNTFTSPFFISSENENRKQANQTPHNFFHIF